MTKDLEVVIDQAIKKVHGTKENDLCKYIPGPTGGYMHHFTMRKMKNTHPSELAALLKKHIVNVDTPKALDPKPRAPRGSRKHRDFINFSRGDIEKVLQLAREVGDHDLLARFSPRRSLPTLKRELIRSIRDNNIQEELWHAYAETIGAMETCDVS